MSHYKDTEQKLSDYLKGKTDAQIELKRVRSEESYKELLNDKKMIEKYLESLKENDEAAYEILVLFYQKEMSWDFIMNEVLYSLSTCKRRRREAIKELSRWLYD